MTNPISQPPLGDARSPDSASFNLDLFRPDPEIRSLSAHTQSSDNESLKPEFT